MALRTWRTTSTAARANGCHHDRCVSASPDPLRPVDPAGKPHQDDGATAIG